MDTTGTAVAGGENRPGRENCWEGVVSRRRLVGGWGLFNARRVGELSLLESLAARTVKKYPVVVGFPNRGEPSQPRAMQAKEYATGFSSPKQNPLRHLKCPHLELVSFTKCRVYVFSKIMHGVNLLKTSQHFGE